MNEINRCEKYAGDPSGCFINAHLHRINVLNEKYEPLGFPVITTNPNDPGVPPSFKK